MGLGKTLQSICILAGKHFERAQKHLKTGSADSVHLPSLIICPPTLTGHWYYEIQKYAEYLRPVLYTGNSRERTRLLTKLQSYDIVITRLDEFSTTGLLLFLILPDLCLSYMISLQANKRIAQDTLCGIRNLIGTK
jgi:SNF2 family DNA or RNA helicase